MNNIDLAQALAIFGITGSALLLAVGYLIKSLISHFLDKDFEAFKIKLQESSEIGKLQYSILQEKRATVISETYSLLATFDNSVRDLMALFQPAGTLPESEKAKIAAADGNKFLNYYTQHKIYFDKETCKLIEDINEKFRKAWIDFQFKDKIQKEKIEDDLWMKSWKTITEEIPIIKEKLEDVFRDILGIKNEKQAIKKLAFTHKNVSFIE